MRIARHHGNRPVSRHAYLAEGQVVIFLINYHNETVNVDFSVAIKGVKPEAKLIEGNQSIALCANDNSLNIKTTLRAHDVCVFIVHHLQTVGDVS